VDFPLTLDKKYLGFVDYLLLKQEMLKKSSFEVSAFDGIRLTAKFFGSFWSIQKGYRDYRALEEELREHTSTGASIVLSHHEAGFTVNVR
jgi:hypothetical protein